MVKGFWWYRGFCTFAVGVLLLELRPSAWSPWIGAGDVMGGFRVMVTEEWRQGTMVRLTIPA